MTRAVTCFVTRFVMRQMLGRPLKRDDKTALQEVLQQDGEITITYRELGESGPEHDKTFTVEVEADGKVLGRGSGHSKKQAEQAAARQALERLNVSGSRE